MMTNTIKKGLLVAMAILMLVAAGCGDDDKKASAPTKQPNVVTAEAGTPEAKIQSSIADAVKSFKVDTAAVYLERIEINKIDDTKYNVNVWAKYTDAPTASLAVKAMKLKAIPVFAGAFKSGQPVERVAFIVNGALVNKSSGKESEAKIFQEELRAAKAKGIDWSHPESIDPDSLGKPWIHQAYHN